MLLIPAAAVASGALPAAVAIVGALAAAVAAVWPPTPSSVPSGGDGGAWPGAAATAAACPAASALVDVAAAATDGGPPFSHSRQRGRLLRWLSGDAATAAGAAAVAVIFPTAAATAPAGPTPRGGGALRDGPPAPCDRVGSGHIGLARRRKAGG